MGWQEFCIGIYLYTMPTTFRLNEILEARGLTQSELARRSGVPFVTINRMCSNKNSGAQLATLDKLADALGVAPGDLIAKGSTKTGKRVV